MKSVLKITAVAGAIALLTACSSNSSSFATTDSDPNALYGGYNVQQLQQRANTVYFAFDSDAINPQYQPLLNAQAAYLVAHPSVQVQVQGYTDERGTPEYNIALGQRRADVVKAYLQQQGVMPTQISTLSYGEEKPAVLGHTEADYAKNRRAVLVY